MSGMSDATIAAALEAFGIEDSSCVLVSHRENRVYAVRLPTGERAALRLHRPGYHTRRALQAELCLLAYLASAGLEVPQPHAAVNGAFLIQAGNPPVMVDLLRWIDGEPLGTSGEPLRHPRSRLPAMFRLIGEMLAGMHSASDRWGPPGGFARPDWGADGLLGENPIWGQFWENPSLDRQETRLLLAARDAARLLLADSGLDHGIIHADPVRENILFTDRGAALIDFDDCGTGYRLFDLATALYPNRHEPDFEDLKQALLSGYAARRHCDISMHMLPLFLFLRSASYVGWIMTRPDLPDTPARNRRFILSAVDQAERFLGIHRKTA